MLQRLAGFDVLAPFLQVALDHHAGDACVASGDLRGHVLRHVDLAAVLLAAVGVREVDHHLRAQARLVQHVAGGLHVGGAVVGRLAAAQDDVAVLVAARLEDRGLAHLGHAHEGVRRLCGQDGVAGHLHAAVGAVLEAHGAGQAAGELAVALALGGARADGAPAHQVADVLRRKQVKKLGAHGQAQRQHVEHQRARHFQPFVDGEAAVHARVVDVALPAYGGAWLLEVHAHHHQQLLRQRRGLRLQQPGVGHGLLVVVDGAGPDDDDEPVVLPMQHARDGGAARLHQALRGLGGWQPLFEDGRCDERADRLDAHVVNARGVVGGKRGGGAVGVQGSHNPPFSRGPGLFSEWCLVFARHPQPMIERGGRRRRRLRGCFISRTPERHGLARPVGAIEPVQPYLAAR